MTFTIEVLLRGTDEVVEQSVERDGREPADWTDDDVRDVLKLALLSFDRVQNPGAEDRTVSLRGLSWIVTPVDEGVAIAIEIPSGAVAAGPFAIDVETLTTAVQRALALDGGPSPTVH